MNTFSLKVGCLFLFGFIFFKSYHTENTNANQFLSHELELKADKLSQETVVISVPVETNNSLIVDYETNLGYLDNTIDQQMTNN